MSVIVLPQPHCVGFFPKVLTPRPDTFACAKVEEICSVSPCIAKDPPNWIEHWRHNDLGFFDTEALARGEIPGDGLEYRLYAYKLYPLVFDGKAEAPYSVSVSLNCDLTGWTFLGYDVVSKSTSSFFECSPLSCNLACQEFTVNRFCLIDDPQEAYGAAAAISKGAYEPGPYYLFEVHRKEHLT